MNAGFKSEIDFSVGPKSIAAYSRLSYTLWYALAEFIDNSTQSRLNYESIVDDVLRSEGQPLIVRVEYNKLRREMVIEDNSIGMSYDDLVNALRIAHPTKDSKGRSKYGMGMKTAACWIGGKWKVVTCEWGSGEEWTASVDVDAIVNNDAKIALNMESVSADKHYTRIVISDLHRNIQRRTEETIRGYLGSMYRFDLRNGRLKILYNGDEILPPDEYEYDTDPDGVPMRRDLPEVQINGKTLRGWVAVLRSGGRKFGGFSLFQNQRQIQGFPNAWKPRSIFGGVDDEGGNNLISQRLTGLIEMDGFDVSHTKDAILFRGDEEEDVEKFLYNQTRDYCNYATRRRDSVGRVWSREKVADLIEAMTKEFSTDEMKDAVSNSVLPPIEVIAASDSARVSSLTNEETISIINMGADFRVVVSLSERSEHEPYLTIATGAEAGKIHVIINVLHPYYSSLESVDAIDECIRQYIYDAIAEYNVSSLTSRLNPNSVRRRKDDLLKARIFNAQNMAASSGDGDDVSTD